MYTVHPITELRQTIIQMSPSSSEDKVYFLDSREEAGMVGIHECQAKKKKRSCVYGVVCFELHVYRHLLYFLLDIKTCRFTLVEGHVAGVRNLNGFRFRKKNK